MKGTLVCYIRDLSAFRLYETDLRQSKVYQSKRFQNVHMPMLQYVVVFHVRLY